MNTLAGFLSNLPLYLRFHANKILIGLIVVCLVALLIRHRMSQAEETRQAVRTALFKAHSDVMDFQAIEQNQPSSMGKAQERKKVAVDVNAAVDEVLNNTSDPGDAALRADALIARADLNWMQANLPPIPGAATQPALKMALTPEEYLNDAAKLYQRILTDYDAQKVAKTSALFGLAAIEENRGNWDKAEQNYNALIADDKIPRAFKDVARQRLAILPQLKAPVFLGAYSSTRPSTQSATEPTTQPVTQATTTAATQPGL